MDEDTDSDLELLPRRERAACRPSAPPGNWGTARERAGTPGSVPGPPPTTGHCPLWGTRPHAPPRATVLRRAGSRMRPRAAA